jgi:hypothetical protein
MAEQSLQLWQVKQLLQDVEETSRYSINFLETCNFCPKIYGESGSLLRRAFQKKLEHLKRLTVEKYVHLLKRSEVEPGLATQRLLSEAEHHAEDDLSEEEGTMMNSPSRFDTTPRPQCARPTFESPQGSFHGMPRGSMTSPPPSYEYHDVSEKFLVVQEGTAKNPWRIPVDINRAERNREFDIELVRDVTHGDFTQSTFHIRKDISIWDNNL